jgi:hypothetical protein
MAGRDGQLSAKAQASLGLPDGFRAYSPYPFGGVNTQATPVAMKDTEFLWLENFVRLGDGNLRTVWDKGTPIYTATSSLTIIWNVFFNIGTTYYCAVFLSDGSAIQVALATGTQTTIGPAGTFYRSSSGYLPYARQWGTQYLLICNRNTQDDYWVWDGTLLYSAGSAAAGGVNILAGGAGYSSTPTLTIYGGFGSGMTISPVISGGQIVEMNITNPGSGYEPGDVVQVAFNGGGSNNSAILTAALTATTLAGVTVTAPGSGYTFASIQFNGGGGGSGATATATITNGQITAITVTNVGSGYTTAPSVQITGNGSGAEASAVLTPAGVSSTGLTVVNGGSGFTSVPLLTLVGGGGAGATAIAVLTGTSVASVNLAAGGSGYTSAPTVAFVGGGGTGAAATAVLQGDTVGRINLTTGGTGYTSAIQVTITGGAGSGAGATVLYTPTSIASAVLQSTGQFYTTAPAVEVTPGANNSAAATVTLMPFGISGSVMETYLSRVWIFNPAPSPTSTLPPGGNWNVSAPGSFVDYATSDGGVAALNTDAFLDLQYTQVRQSSGYLYALGNGSVSVVSNVQTSGEPAETSYNYQNVDPQAGCAWRDSLQDFSRSTIFANTVGIFGLYGGAATKISGNLDGIFVNAVFPPTVGAITPCAAIATIFDIKHYLLLMTVMDPDTQALRNVMVTWNEKDWVVTSQTVSLEFIATLKQGSLYAAYGTDGNSIYPMFNMPSSSLSKRIETKFYGGDKVFIEKAGQAIWLQGQDNSVGEVGISGSLEAVISGIGGAFINEQSVTVPAGVSSPFLNPVAFTSPYPYWNVWATSIQGNAFFTLGIRFTTQSPDFTLSNLLIGYTEAVAFFA